MASVRITKLDFVPKDRGSDYNILWPKPRRHTRYTDVKHYIPLVELGAVAPVGFTLFVGAVECRDMASDIYLTLFSVHFKKGGKTPDVIRMPNNIPGPPRDLPDAPQFTYGSFWLAAGKDGKVRGNAGTGDDRHAIVYLKRNTYWLPEDSGGLLLPGPAGITQGRKHTVRTI